MQPFLPEDFLLQFRTARTLYHEFAEGMPIFDYHCHLPAAEIAADKNFENLDQKNGIERQLDALSNMGLLSRFVGMLTDSRSFLSYPRHEYFRRVLCNRLGSEVESGELPDDLELVGGMVKDTCFRNAAAYFGIEAGRDTAENLFFCGSGIPPRISWPEAAPATNAFSGPCP